MSGFDNYGTQLLGILKDRLNILIAPFPGPRERTNQEEFDAFSDCLVQYGKVVEVLTNLSRPKSRTGYADLGMALLDLVLENAVSFRVFVRKHFQDGNFSMINSDWVLPFLQFEPVAFKNVAAKHPLLFTAQPLLLDITNKPNINNEYTWFMIVDEGESFWLVPRKREQLGLLLK